MAMIWSFRWEDHKFKARLKSKNLFYKTDREAHKSLVIAREHTLNSLTIFLSSLSCRIFMFAFIKRIYKQHYFPYEIYQIFTTKRQVRLSNIKVTY